MYTKDKLTSELLPHNIRGAVERWIEFGEYPGTFLVGILMNDLRLAALNSMPINECYLTDIVKWFVQYAPCNCWGSEGNVQKWAEMGGLNGELE